MLRMLFMAKTACRPGYSRTGSQRMDYQAFRARLGIIGTKEPDDATRQRTTPKSMPSNISAIFMRNPYLAMLPLPYHLAY